MHPTHRSVDPEIPRVYTQIEEISPCKMSRQTNYEDIMKHYKYIKRFNSLKTISSILYWKNRCLAIIKKNEYNQDPKFIINTR